MLKTGFLTHWGGQSIFLLTILCLRISGAHEKTSPFLVSLFSNGRVFHSASEVTFGGMVSNKGESEVDLLTSIFRVRDPSGRDVFSEEGAFGFGNMMPSLHLKGSLTSGGSPSLPNTLPEGAYQAVWTVNGIGSNVVHFQIRSERDERATPELEIDKVVLEVPSFRDECILGYFRNDQAKVIDIADLWEHSILRIDGVPYKRIWFKWGGFSSLQSGHSWGFILSPLDYSKTLEPGRHRVQFQMGDIRSNILEIVWPKK